MMVMPGGAREWKRVSASGVRRTWSLCWHNSSSMCAMSTTRVSAGQSMNAHGSSGRGLAAATGEAGPGEGPPRCVVMMGSYTVAAMGWMGGQYFASETAMGRQTLLLLRTTAHGERRADWIEGSLGWTRGLRCRSDEG